jgi:hypothetical protein
MHSGLLSGICGAQQLMSCTVACSVAYVMHSGLCGAQRLMSCTVACVNVAVFLRGAQVLNSFLA